MKQRLLDVIAWEGIRGRIMSTVMATGNADMERAAIHLLDPNPTDAVLVIGCGPGVGARMLAERLGQGRVVATDPSSVMARSTSRRIRRARLSQSVEVLRASAHALPAVEGSIDGVVSVNNIQLWPDLDAGLAEVARVLRGGGRFVVELHEWAVPEPYDVTSWMTELSDHMALVGLVARSTRRRVRYRSGRGFEVLAERIQQ